MNKAKQFLKEAGKGGKGKKITTTITVQEYDKSMCSGYCEYARTEAQQLGQTHQGSQPFSSDSVYYCNLLEERTAKGKRRPACLKVFGA
jgi:hypothetical protein